MYIVVNLQFAQYFGELFALFCATFLKKPCKSTMLSMDYQIWRTRKAEAEAMLRPAHPHPAATAQQPAKAIALIWLFQRSSLQWFSQVQQRLNFGP